MKRLLTLILMLTIIVLSSISLAFAAPMQSNQLLTTFLPPSPTPPNQPPKPLVLLTIYNPWLMVIGSDEPTFALYDNGLVIYQRKNTSGDFEFASVQLTDDEFKTLKSDLKIDKDLYALDANKDYYTKTDQPTNVIRLSDAVLGDKTISIYGDLFDDPEARQMAAPKRLIDLFDTLTGYSHPKAQTWLPEKFEVMLWSCDTADAVLWPSDWPTLTDPTTVQRESLYSIYVPISEYDHYLKLRQKAYAVRLDGKNWSFSARFPFPHELKFQ
ncbi:MAG: hypothetical protein GC179_01785 [Anaerolineaceae bacterium]|nr:hypothetical protein [Anaerolineaceae bacterium]